MEPITEAEISDEPEEPWDRRWIGITRWTWVKIFAGFFACMGIFGFYITQQNGKNDLKREHHHNEEAAQQLLNNNYRSCVSGNDVRQELRDLIVFTYSQQGGVLDFTLIPGYQDLDPATKIYFMNLTNLLASSANSDNNQKRIDAALDKVPLRDCLKEFPGAQH